MQEDIDDNDSEEYEQLTARGPRDVFTYMYSGATNFPNQIPNNYSIHILILRSLPTLFHLHTWSTNKQVKVPHVISIMKMLLEIQLPASATCQLAKFKF
jgi:hypothetical protein